MERNGYSISSGAYSEIEAGISTPKDPQRFVITVARCLAIEEGSPDWDQLVFELGYAILRKKPGPLVDDFLRSSGDRSGEDGQT